jgi:hypothetical protein
MPAKLGLDLADVGVRAWVIDLAAAHQAAEAARRHDHSDSAHPVPRSSHDVLHRGAIAPPQGGALHEQGHS